MRTSILGLVLSVSWLAPSARAHGIRAVIDDYVFTVERRVAAQAAVSHGSAPPWRFEALCRREARLARQLERLVDHGDDLSEIVMRRLCSRLADAGLAFPVGAVPYDAPRAARLRAAMRVLERPNRRPATRPTAAKPRPGSRRPSGGRPTGPVDIEPDLAAFTRVADQKPTYYFTGEEQGFPASGVLYGHSYDGSERREIRTPGGQVIAETSGRYFALLCMEGSGVLLDGRGVGYVSDQRFELLPPGCSGLGATGYWVVPFHTLAVNPRELPYRGVYYTPALRGLRLPDGTTHDGYWFAHDTGSAFQGAPTHRVDMYVRTSSWVDWMELNFVPSFTPVQTYRVDEATRARVYETYAPYLGR